MLTFAGLLMIMVGIFHAIQGVVALFNNNFYVVGEEYLFKVDVTAYGWIHIILGLVVAGAGFGLFRGAVWARTVAVIVASVSMVASFVSIPYYPHLERHAHRLRRLRHLGRDPARPGHRQ